jgi:hypothetical protein
MIAYQRENISNLSEKNWLVKISWSNIEVDKIVSATCTWAQCLTKSGVMSLAIC